MSRSPQSLALLDQAHQLLEQARSLSDLKSLRDAAETARTYARAAQLGLDLQNKAAELKLRAERKAGAFLAGLCLRGGDRRSKTPRVALKLEDLGVSKRQSELWQLAASVPDDAFEHYITSTCGLGQELTAVGLRRLARDSDATPSRKRRPEPRGKRPIGTPAHDATRAELLELVIELREHSELLNSLVAPFDRSAGGDLGTAERRHVARLAEEIKGSLARLHTLLWEGAPSHKRGELPANG